MANKVPQTYRDLEIYRLAHPLAVEIHFMTMDLPKYEMYEEGSQIRRSAKAVPVNIVEGFARRRYKNEFIKFLVYAHASCEETIEHLELLGDTKSLSEERFRYFFDKYDELARKLFRFIKAVETGHKTR